MFNGLYPALMALAAAFVLVPGLPLIPVIVATQTLNALLLPVVLAFVVRLANDGTLMGRHAGSILAWRRTAVGEVAVRDLTEMDRGGLKRSFLFPLSREQREDACG